MMNLFILKNVIIEVPIIQIAILVGLCSLLALIGRYKFILISLYAAILYWVFFLNETKFGFSKEAQVLFTGLFIVTSVVFVACSAWVFIVER